MDPIFCPILAQIFGFSHDEHSENRKYLWKMYLFSKKEKRKSLKMGNLFCQKDP